MVLLGWHALSSGLFSRLEAPSRPTALVFLTSVQQLCLLLVCTVPTMVLNLDSLLRMHAGQVGRYLNVSLLSFQRVWGCGCGYAAGVQSQPAPLSAPGSLALGPSLSPTSVTHPAYFTTTSNSGPSMTVHWSVSVSLFPISRLLVWYDNFAPH